MIDAKNSEIDVLPGEQAGGFPSMPAFRSSEAPVSEVKRMPGDKLALTKRLPSRSTFAAGNSSLAASQAAAKG
jgi:hypothetical protein